MLVQDDILARQSDQGMKIESNNNTHIASEATQTCASKDKAPFAGLLDTLTSEDVYVKTAKAVVMGVKGWQLARIIMAFLFTALLQMGLIILVWNGMPKGFDVRTTGYPDRLWVQAGQMQRQLCWLQRHAQLKDPDSVDWNVSRDCMLAWPRPVNGSHDCTWYLNNPNWDASKMPDAAAVEGYLMRNWSRVQFPKVHDRIQHADKWYSNMSYLDDSELCRSLRDFSSLGAFAEGLFYPQQQDRPNAQLYQGGWNSPYGLVHSHALCIEGREKLSYGDDPDDPSSFPNLLALLALTVYVHDEAMRSYWLAYVAAACVGVVPRLFNTRRVDTISNIQHANTAKLLLLLFVPLSQLLVACAVLFTGSALFLTANDQENTLSIIFNAVALGFVLEVDNKLGAILGLQDFPGWDVLEPVGGIARDAEAENDSGSVESQGADNRTAPTKVMLKLIGVLYFGVLGFFICWSQC